LHHCTVRPCRSEGAHGFEVSRRKPLHVGKGLPQVSGEAVNDLGTPTFRLLTAQDDLADFPIRQHHRGIGCQHRPQPGIADALLDFIERAAVARRHLAHGY
jgi:hypothetical protein